METWEDFPDQQARQATPAVGFCRGLVSRPMFQFPSLHAVETVLFRGKWSTQPRATTGQHPCPSAKWRYLSVLTCNPPCEPRPVGPKPTETITAFRSKTIVDSIAVVHGLPSNGRYAWIGIIQKGLAAVHHDTSFLRGNGKTCISGDGGRRHTAYRCFRTLGGIARWSRRTDSFRAY
jgi:hypothetical protein